MTDAAPEYWAFISYSHADSKAAAWLHRSLEGYRVPRRLVGQQTPCGAVPRKLFPVFLDRDELAGSSELGPELQRALRQSRWLIVVCSPESARSRWVDEEVRYFKSLGRADRVLALIIAGDPHASETDQPELECFPPAVCFQVTAQGELSAKIADPIAADARADKDGKHRALLKLISGILGVGFDDLYQRELQARHRRMALLTGMSLTVAAVTMALAILALQAREDARRRQSQAEDLIQFMVGDLHERLEAIGKLEVLDSVGDKAMQYFSTLNEKDLSVDALAAQAKALRQIGEVRISQGSIDGAEDAFAKALNLSSELLRRRPYDTELIFDVAEAEFSVGAAYYSKGELEAAETWFRRQASRVEQLLEINPDNGRWIREYGYAYGNLGAVAYKDGRLSEAWRFNEIAHEAQKRLANLHPDDPDFLIPLATAQGWLGSIAFQLRAWPDAIDHSRAERETLAHLMDLAPDNSIYKWRRVLASIRQLAAQAQLGELKIDDPVLVEADKASRELFELDQDNIKFVRSRFMAAMQTAQVALTLGQLEDVERISHEASKIASDLFARAPDDDSVKMDFLRAKFFIAQFDWMRGRQMIARKRITELINQFQGNPSLDSEDVRFVERKLQTYLFALWIEPSHERTPLLRQSASGLYQEMRKDGQPLDPDTNLRFHVLFGDRVTAGEWVRQLSPGERIDPFLRQFCEAHGISCAGGLHSAAPSKEARSLALSRTERLCRSACYESSKGFCLVPAFTRLAG